MAVQRKFSPLSRDVLESAARILGPSSAAAKALADADSHDGDAYFFRLGNTIVIQKVTVNAVLPS